MHKSTQAILYLFGPWPSPSLMAVSSISVKFSCMSCVYCWWPNIWCYGRRAVLTVLVEPQNGLCACWVLTRFQKACKFQHGPDSTSNTSSKPDSTNRTSSNILHISAHPPPTILRGSKLASFLYSDIVQIQDSCSLVETPPTPGCHGLKIWSTKESVCCLLTGLHVRGTIITFDKLPSRTGKRDMGQLSPATSSRILYWKWQLFRLSWTNHH